MNITELIEQLQAFAAEHGDVEVRLAVQPNWPFEHSIGSVALGQEPIYEGTMDPEDGTVATAEDEVPAIIYIGEGRQLGYLPAMAREGLGW